MTTAKRIFTKNFNNGCEVTSSFHEFSFDLQTDKEGNFYYTKAGPVRPGGRGWQIISDNNGSVLKVSKDGSKFSVYATGLRAPNGMSISPKTGMMTVGDNEGTWVPACPIRIVHEGDVLGVPDLYHNDAASKAYVPPVCWLPHSDVDNSSGGQVWVETGDKWGPFEHRLLHTSYGTCSLFLVMMETVDNTVQGGVVKFPNLDFITGICRPRFNPVDHQLYVVGLRGWQTTAAKDCGFPAGALHRRAGENADGVPCQARRRGGDVHDADGSARRRRTSATTRSSSGTTGGRAITAHPI